MVSRMLVCREGTGFVFNAASGGAFKMNYENA